MCLAYLCRHAPYCLQYLGQVRNHQNFRFCAIPQIMAIGTLSLCYNNPKVFAGELLQQQCTARAWRVPSSMSACLLAPAVPGFGSISPFHVNLSLPRTGSVPPFVSGLSYALQGS